jgi:hypothetical protein
VDAVEQAKETVEQAKDKVREVGSRDREKKSLPRRLFVPLAASAVSGATAYAARKAPGFFQEKVVPKLKELASNGGTLEKAKQAVEGAVPGVGDGGGGQRERPRRKVSDQQRAKQQRERAARRRERREALTK